MNKYPSYIEVYKGSNGFSRMRNKFSIINWLFFIMIVITICITFFVSYKNPHHRLFLYQGSFHKNDKVAINHVNIKNIKKLIQIQISSLEESNDYKIGLTVFNNHHKKLFYTEKRMHYNPYAPPKQNKGELTRFFYLKFEKIGYYNFLIEKIEGTDTPISVIVRENVLRVIYLKIFIMILVMVFHYFYKLNQGGKSETFFDIIVLFGILFAMLRFIHDSNLIILIALTLTMYFYLYLMDRFSPKRRR